MEFSNNSFSSGGYSTMSCSAKNCAKGRADSFQGRNRGNSIPFEDIRQRKLGKPTCLRHPVRRRSGRLRQHRCCFTGHRAEKLNRLETEVVEGLKKKSAQQSLMDFKHSYQGKQAESISGRRRSCWLCETGVQRSGPSTPGPYKGFESCWSRECKSDIGGYGAGRSGVLHLP